MFLGNETIGNNGIIDLRTYTQVTQIYGEEDYGRISTSLGNAGDINNDGIKDLIMGSYKLDPLGRIDAGGCHIIFGDPNIGNTGDIDLRNLTPQMGVRTHGEQPGDNCGISARTIGDINGDNTDDVAIGAWKANPLGRNDAGIVYVVYGRSDIANAGDIDLRDLTYPLGCKILGERAGDQLGDSVSTAGDMNGDNISDLFIGASGADPFGRVDAGTSYLLYGGPEFCKTGVIDLLNQNNITQVVRFYGEKAGDNSGRSVGIAGDINHDGRPDLVIGAQYADPPGKDNAGISYVIFGKPSKISSSEASSPYSSETSSSNGASSLTQTLSSQATQGSVKASSSSEPQLPSSSTQSSGFTDDSESSPKILPITSSELSDTKNTNVIPILGGIIGGVILFCGVTGFVAYLLYKRNRNPERKIDLESLQRPKSPQQTHFGTLDDRGSIEICLAIPYSKLTFDEKVGSGGSGIVYKGTWKKTVVAIKELFNVQFDIGAIDEFKKETSLMANLRHPNIVQLLGISIDKLDHYCIVMEYMARGSLYDFLHSNAEITWQLCFQLASDISHALAYLHGENILHRDLKSLNVLLTNELKAKLADFGISKINTETMQTMTKGILGTPRWMAPEIMITDEDKTGEKKSRIYTDRSDMYSLAIIFWELLSRKDPFDQIRHDLVVMSEVKNGTRPQIPDTCPPKFASLISDCWKQRPEERPTSSEVVERIEEQQKELTEFIP